jgi:hypothetical protein
MCAINIDDVLHIANISESVANEALQLRCTILCHRPAYGGTPMRVPSQTAPYAYAATPGQPHYASMPTPVPAATPAVFNEPEQGDC